MKQLLVLFASVALTGCLGTGTRMPQCSGPVTATVNNNWRYPVDMYAEVSGTSGHMLGEIDPGERRTFELPAGATGVVYRWRGAFEGSAPRQKDVAISYGCR